MSINVTELRDYIADKESHDDYIAVIDIEQLAALLDAVEALRDLVCRCGDEWADLDEVVMAREKLHPLVWEEE